MLTGDAVGEVAAVVEAHAEHGVAGLEQGEVDADVGVGTRVRLHVGVLGAEQALHPVDRQLSRSRRRPGCRRSTACRGSPRSTCW